MRLMFITTSYPSSLHPTAGIFVHLLAKALQQRGHHIRVITPGDEAECGRSVFEGIEVQRVWYGPKFIRILAQKPGGILPVLRAKPYLALALPLLGLFMLKHVAAYRSQCDVIHGHWCITSLLNTFSRLGKRPQPFVMTLRGDDVKLFAQKIFRKLFSHLRLLDVAAITTVSASLSQELRTLLATDEATVLPTAAIHTIPNGVEESFFEIPASTCTETTEIIYIGSLIPRKRVDFLIHACKIALDKGSNLHLTVIGEGSEQEKISYLIDKYDLCNFVKIIPFVDHQYIPKILYKAHCLALFSVSEGRPNVVIEAMAAGRAILATALPCIDELFGDAACGYTAPVDDIEALADMLMKACADRPLLQRMGECARQRVIDLGLHWDNTAKKYEEIYQKALEKTFTKGKKD